MSELNTLILVGITLALILGLYTIWLMYQPYEIPEEAIEELGMPGDRTKCPVCRAYIVLHSDEELVLCAAMSHAQR